MRNVLATDIKNNIRSIRFILGIFLIVSATLMSEHEMLQKIINAGGSAEGPGWFVAYTYCMNSVNMLLFVPIAVAFAGGENTEAELHSRFFLFSYIRSGRKQYLVGKAAGLLVSGGLTAFLVGLSLLDWKLAILIEAIIPLKFIIVSYCANKKREVFEQWIEDKRKFMSWFAECINGIHEMKLWNLFQVKKSQFEGLQKDLMDSYKKNAMLDEYSTVSVVVIDTVVNALLYILSGLFIIKGEFTIGGAFAFITYSAYVVNPISALINIKYYFAQIEPSAKRLFELWGQPEELEMKLCEMKPEKIYQDRDMVFEVKNLVFGYEPGHPILNGISLCVKKGERIAIVGENGSGKSTLLNLLAGFYRPQKGIIKLYGAPVELMDIQDMRNRIAVISQRPYLFQGTIEENVNIDGKASRDAVVEACRKSGALGFIEKLDHGFGQKIGQDGAKLSGGERQKIAVARALLKNADILLMDEATEGFDVESNEALRELLHSELKNKTIVFITHKYKELESVDKVYRLSKGILELVRS